MAFGQEQRSESPNDLETARLAALERYRILDTASEADFDNLADLARFVSNAPVSAITFVDADRMWVKAITGVSLASAPRNKSFCGIVVESPDGPTLVEDATKDPRFAKLPFVEGEPFIRFYAGIPLVTPDGFAIGALCVANTAPGSLTAEQLNALTIIAGQVIALLELRRSAHELAVARDAALAAERSKSSFLTNMSHEIRTPMNGVLGIAALLKTTELNESQKLYLRTIEQSAESLMRLLGDVLDYADLMVGRTTLVLRPVNVHELVAQIDDLMKPVAVRRNLRLVSMVSQSIDSPIISDPLRLRQIVTQLVDNAIKFTLEGSIELQVKKVGSFLRFSVRDTGIGVPPEMLGTILEPFGKTGSLGTPVAGRGLGLSAVCELLGLMKSELNIESEPGVGSTFWFNLPTERTSSAGARERFTAPAARVS